MSMFQLQGFYARDVINGRIKICSTEMMEKAYALEKAEEAELKTVEDTIHFQAKYVNHLSTLTNEQNIDTTGSQTLQCNPESDS